MMQLCKIILLKLKFETKLFTQMLKCMICVKMSLIRAPIQSSTIKNTKSLSHFYNKELNDVKFQLIIVTW